VPAASAANTASAAALALARVAASASSAMLSSAAATPSCSGVGAQKVAYECINRMGAISVAGPCIQPTRQPVRHSSLLELPTVSVRADIPGTSIIRTISTCR